ncbi:hypothetical protein EMCRGX_G026818 [Ephydatia muelleri]|eukprot:Em0014g684a
MAEDFGDVSSAPLSAEEPPLRKKIGGWADDTTKSKKKKEIPAEEEDERLNAKTVIEEEGGPIIPDLEEVQEETLTAQVAAPPSVMVNRVDTYKQLESDLHKHAGLFTLENEVDLKLLAKVLSPEADVIEEDKPWEWGKVFAELSTDIQEVWDRQQAKVPHNPT